MPPFLVSKEFTMKHPLLLLCGIFLSFATFAQTTVDVEGTVLSKDGNPVVANVMIKGSTTGTSANDQGKYQLKNVQAQAVLVFSSIGFQSQEVAVNGRSVINVTMDRDVQSLDEVIAVAYGTAKKGTYTGSASVINDKDIKDVPTLSFQNALVGKAPGVSVTSGSGQAGSAPSIQIRGIGSMNASTQPLYVIDGVPVISGSVGQLGDYILTSNNVMSSLNPEDIESISILKDAAAASLYGSRAANGVVLITTKSGKSGKPKITLRSSIGFTPSWATDNYEVANTQDNVNYLYRVFHDYNTSNGKTDAEANADALRRLNDKFNKHGYYFETDGDGVGENVHIKGMTDGKVNREGKYFDWEDAYFRTGIYQSNDIAVSGGTENTKYYSSLSYTKDKNRIKVNQYDRITGRVNLSQKIGKHLVFDSRINVSNTNFSGYNDTRNLRSNYYEQTRNLLWGLYWPTDYKTGEPWTDRYGSLAINNLFYDKEWENTSKTLRVFANEALTVKILPGLNIKSVFSYDNTRTKDHLYYSRIHYNGEGLGTVSEMTTDISNIVSSTTLNFDHDFGLHHLSFLAGFEAEKNKTDYQRSSGKDLPSSGLHTVVTAGELDASAYYWGNNMESILSRIAYNYNQKYFASASYRRDGSSKLGPDSRWGNFWSVAAAWKLDREAFLEDIEALSNLRLRASYGVNGTLPPADYGWRSLNGYTLKYMDQAGGGPSSIADANLSWETNYSLDLALEFGLFDQRLSGTIEYFNRDSRDLLQSVPISRITGFSSTLKNIGSINNRGLEIQFNGDLIRNAHIIWSAGINGTFIKSRVTKLSDGDDIIWYDNVDLRGQYIYREGESTLAFYGYEYAGIDHENGKSRYYVNDKEDKTKGDFLINGRGATYDYHDANYVIIGNGIPDVYGGIHTAVQYKGFALSLSFIYKLGGQLYDGAEKDVADDGYYWERTRSQIEIDNMWTEEHPERNLPKVRGIDLTDAIQYSSRHIYNASFLRLKDVNLSYNLPTSVIHKLGLSGTRIYFDGLNLLTFSKYKNADPEVNQFATRGWETPFGKTYTFGIELSF